VHNCALWRTIGATLAVSGILAIGAAFALPAAASNDLRGALAVYGFGALIFGGVGALWAQTRMRVEAAQRSGGDVQAAARGDPRWRGGALAVFGTALVAIVAAVMLATVSQLLFPGRAIEGTRFAGSAEDARIILLVFAAVMAVGVTSVVYGLWMWYTRREDRRVMAVMVVIFAALFVVVRWL
jgi:hypothetical protein